MTSILTLLFSIYVVGFLLFLLLGFSGNSPVKDDTDPIGTAFVWPIALIFVVEGLFRRRR